MALFVEGREITQFSDMLERQLKSGQSGRVSLGSKDSAFSWATSLPRGLWDFVPKVSVEGPSFGAIRMSPTATPAIKVPERGTKPVGVAVESFLVPVDKYAAMSTFSLEAAAYSDALASAVAATITGGCLSAFEADCAAALVTDAGGTVTGSADWTTAVLEAVGVIAANGGRPDLLVMSAADFAAAVVGGVPQLTFTAADAIPSYLGLALHLSSGMAPGTAIVADRTAVIVAESVASPIATIDVATLASTNEARLVIDVMGAVFVRNPGSVVSLVPTLVPLGRTDQPKESKK